MALNGTFILVAPPYEGVLLGLHLIPVENPNRVDVELLYDQSYPALR